MGAAAGCAGKAYVNNNRDGTLSVITMATGRVSSTIPVGNSPISPTITPDGKYVYVAHLQLKAPCR